MMDDTLGPILGFLFVAWLVISAVLFVLGAIFTGLLWLSINLFVIADEVLGMWSFIPPILSWAVSGLALGSMVHYGLVEFRQLPAATDGLLWVGMSVILAVSGVILASASLVSAG